jgi:hypothetical protein
MKGMSIAEPPPSPLTRHPSPFFSYMLASFHFPSDCMR